MSISRRHFGALACLAATGRAAAQVPRSYAVVSEFARTLSVVIHQDPTGTRLGNNLKSNVTMPDGVLDKVALLAARNEIRKRQPAAAVWLVAPMDTDLFGERRVFTEGDALAMPADMAAELKQRGSTHLLLMTRYRGEGDLQMRNRRETTQPLEGIGFYLNRLQPMKDYDTGVETTGFLAPFMHARLALIEVASTRVVAARTVRHALVHANTRPDTLTPDPWQSLKDDEKGPYLAKMIDAQLAEALPPLLG